MQKRLRAVIDKLTHAGMKKVLSISEHGRRSDDPNVEYAGSKVSG